MSTITATELAVRVRTNSHTRLDQPTAQTFLEEWQTQGIAEQVTEGEWRLTETGRAMFAGWANHLDLEAIA